MDVLARLRAEGRDAMLVMAGNGPLLAQTNEHLRSLGMEPYCKLLGELSEQHLRHIYAASDVFIAPSEIEGVSRSLYEAMAMGCVPVVTDVGGQRELVIAGTGALIPPQSADPAPYVAAIEPLFDPDRRLRASVASRTHIRQRFDSTSTVASVLGACRLAQRRRPDHQGVLPEAMAEQLAVLSLEVIRRHVARAAGR